jgi:hypothetical protein
LEKYIAGLNVNQKEPIHTSGEILNLKLFGKNEVDFLKATSSASEGFYVYNLI